MKPMLTTKLREKFQKELPPEKLLPDTQPAYVASLIYVFGVLTIAAFLMILASGLKKAAMVKTPKT